MHADEIHIDISLVKHLLNTQFPQWANQPIQPVRSSGTENVIYRLGAKMMVRLPRYPGATRSIDKEHLWLPKLAPLLPLSIPVPLAKGIPDRNYPFHWSVFEWIEGENASIDSIDNPCDSAIAPRGCSFAIALAELIIALQKIDTTGAPLAVKHNLRGVPLVTRDTAVRKAIHALQDTIDTDTVTKVWETALQAPDWNREPVWFHGDLLPGNLLFNQGRLSAVIDFGGLGAGDPACDLMIAWGLLRSENREVFRTTLGVDDATWIRGQGHGLSQALIFIPYYINTNPVGVSNARSAIAEIIKDFRRETR
ncbi:aminoglycoside phosphotransferase family protein [Plectonema cf. radiosum LEGE 06105]|uniref:Aminoglycoside phosphotransferase family protein n=2 Tax=Plectonema TaxID=1183 RepID=A0A8J7F5B1_9CYAN|nr:aminoglycoside phosphotransferase family protein [Plectonema cf. radiosum LEGE 06105]